MLLNLMLRKAGHLVSAAAVSRRPPKVRPKGGPPKVRPKGGRSPPELRPKGALLVANPATYIMPPLEAAKRSLNCCCAGHLVSAAAGSRRPPKVRPKGGRSPPELRPKGALLFDLARLKTRSWGGLDSTCTASVGRCGFNLARLKMRPRR
jgi:hypothetical protein